MMTMHKAARAFAPALAALALSAAAAAHGWIEVNVAPNVGGRTDSAIAYDKYAGKAVLFGGSDGTTLHNDTWEFNGATWTQVATSPPALLTPRSKHAMVFQTLSGGNMIMFGGIDTNGPKNDTWIFNGTNWGPGPAPAAGLTARANHAMVWDDPRGLVVLFGGWDGTYYNDTWECNGVLWFAGPAPAAGLTARDSHAMAWDSTRNLTVLFGGWDGTSALNDTWEYNGTAWSQGPTAPGALTGRSRPSLYQDPRKSLLVLYGGFDGASTLSDTWQYDGVAWTAGATSPAALGPRSSGAMTADGNQVIFFGGESGSNTYTDTWRYSSATEDYLVGSGLAQPNANLAAIINSGGVLSTSFTPYSAGQWGTTVAAGAIDGAVAPDVLTGPGPGPIYGPQVRAFRRDGTTIAKVNFYAYGTLKYGVNEAGGKTDADAYEEILTGAGPGAVFGPHVRGFNFDNATLTSIAKISFFAYSTLKYGVNVASGDLDDDGFGEILTGAGPSAIFAPTVRGFNVDGGAVTSMGKINFNAFTTLQYGVTAAGGDVDQDGFDEIACAPGPGSALVRRFVGFNFDNVSIAALANFDAYPGPVTYYGGRVGLGDIGDDPGQDLICGDGVDPTADSSVWTYSYMGVAPNAYLFPMTNTFVAFTGQMYGVNVAAGLYDR